MLVYHNWWVVSGIDSTFYWFRNVAEKFAFRGLLPLVKCVAVWMPMLTHIQASHTDALKTHSLQTFLPQDWEVKGGQQFFGTSISRKKIDTGEVSALRGGFPGPEGPFSVLQ